MRDFLDTKYNYVFYNVGTDYLEPVFAPLNAYPQVKTYAKAFESSKFIEKLFFYHWSAKLNNRIKLPFKNLWFKKMFVHKFSNDNPVCYVFYMAKYIDECPEIYNYIKRLNSDNKVLIYFGDLLSKRNYDLEKLKKSSDYIFTYDEAEAEKYDIIFGKNSFGYGNILEVTTPTEFENDVYFVGFAKDRLDEIHNVYKQLTDNGLKCKFVVCGTKKEEQIHGDGLIYSNPISYRENIQNVISSKCILDIIQGQSSGITLRVKESIAYKRKLLSNNVLLKNYDAYNDNYMSVYDAPNHIDIDFLKSEIEYDSFKVDKNFGPEKIIFFFERFLLGGNNE